MFDKALINSDHFCLSQPEIITGKSAQEPDFVLDPQETLWVVWSDRQRQGDIIRLRSYQHNEAGPIIDCSTTQGVEFQPTAVCQPDGTIRLVWVSHRNGSWHLVSRALQNGHLGDEQLIVSHTDGLFHPRLALGPDGDCWLAFEQIDDQRPRLMVSQLRNGKWPPPNLVTPPDAACYRPSLAIGPDQGLWMAYDTYRDGAYRVAIQRVDQPSEPVVVTHNGYQNLQATLASDQNGNLWIAWASNQNEAVRDAWWMTKWTYVRRFDGRSFGDPVSAPPGKDVYNEDSFQGWEFPQVAVDSEGRVWLFGQSSHTLYAQYYSGMTWSPLYTIAPRHWGSWKPRMRVAGSHVLYLASMGLEGAQIQKLEIMPSGETPVVVNPVEPLPANQRVSTPAERHTITAPDGKTLRIFFGDLHAHSAYSDAINDVDEFYHRYRDAYGYDFATLTDHDYLDGIELSLSELKMEWNHCDRMTVPGEFVALYGYEWTSPAIAEHAVSGQAVGEGHRHILYPDQNGPLISYGEESANTGKKLLKRLSGVNALVIPHHTSWSGTDWEAHDEELQRLVEVCSTHGRFEFPGNKPIGYRRDHVQLGKFVLDGLARGYKLGFVGGSDSHGLRWHATEVEGRDSHVPPGTRVGWKEDAFRTGMTAILAPELTREALYEALFHRRCYATSGVPIGLDFRMDGQLMGSDIVVHAAPHIDCVAKGTAPIRSAEIIRSGHVFAGLYCRDGEGLTTLSFSLQDTIIIPGESHYYYLRITQEDGNMAWSSPIWVKYKEKSHAK